MKNTNVYRISKILGLVRHVVGVKFIDFKEDFEALDYSMAPKKGSWCYLVRTAMDGQIFKADENSITCDYSKYALGLSKPDTTISEGRSYHFCGLYESNAIAKNITKAMRYPNHSIAGVVVGPLEMMEDADVVIICDNAEVMMRIMQGYGYKYGNPENLSFFGNQAMCADLTSKPYSNNDINISMFCKGTRQYGRFDSGELGAAFPISMFDNIAEGIIKTMNVVSYNDEKRKILDSLDNEDDLGVEIKFNCTYGQGLIEHDTAAYRKRK